MKISPKTVDLFARAHELNGEARESFLTDACGDDAELRLEVQNLLMKAEKVDSFFGDEEGETLVGNNLEGTGTEGEGDRVGPYVLRQQIGEGGFGTVWMAEQSEPISRMVAVKVVKPGMDTKQVLARFEAERQALAMMDHPNIATILDAGVTEGGRPYFAMELVKGIPITQFCNDRNYDHRQRLELFRDVCSAVNHAHQKGVIHRDLKPSNVMVTLVADEPVVKIIDFGIAKAVHSKLTDHTLFTRFEQFLGTPVYMSPEQAAMSGLDVDTRSDIYCLGVLLYELLAGAPPFDQKTLHSADYDEMRRIIREDEPPSPSTRLTQIQSGTADGRPKHHVNATSLKGELDWIVMKAIEKDRTRRYETASALARDIGRYLDDEPVQAAAPSSAYKLRKFALRHRAAIGTAAAMVLMLLAGIATTTWQAIEATKEKNRAVAAEALAGQRLEETEAARKDAEQFSNVLKDTLEKQMFGYWVVDVEETPAPTKEEIEEEFEAAVAEAQRLLKDSQFQSASAMAEEISEEIGSVDEYFEPILRSLTFEIRKGEMTVYGPEGPVTGKFALKSSDKAGNTLIIEIPGEDETSEVAIERDKLTLKSGKVMVLKRISKDEFEKRREADKEASGWVENEVLPISFEDQELKRHLSAAAAIDTEVFEKIVKGEIVDPETITADGESLTDHLMLGTLKGREEGKKFFFHLNGPVDPAKLAEALNPTSDSPVSVLHPGYITSLDYQIDGRTLSGRIEFKAKNGVFEGAVGFEAVRGASVKDGWLINAFLLEEEGLRLERKGKDAPWRRVEIGD